MNINTSEPSLVGQAQRMALPLAMCWVLAFVCQMGAMRSPLLGWLSNGIGLYALFAFGRSLALLRLLKEMRVMRVLTAAFITCLFCTLLTTFSQMLYFGFVDKGRFMAGVLEVLEQPQFAPVWAEGQLGMTLDEFKRQVAGITLGDLAGSLLMINTGLSVLFTVMATLLSYTWRKKN